LATTQAARGIARAAGGHVLPRMPLPGQSI